MTESLMIWGALLAYAVASVLFIIGLAFGQRATLRWGTAAAAVGLALQSVAILSRWRLVGHGPYLGFYEVAGLLAWTTVLVFLLLAYRYRGLASLGALVLPLALVVLGAALLADSSAQPVVGTLASLWLVIHVLFANLSFACYAGAFFVASAYLLGTGRRTSSVDGLLARLPAAEELDALTARLVAAGFLLQGLMIVTGAIWANEAWGRYWAWDPIEAWSLAAWAVYAVWLHLRLTLGWQGRRTAWLAVAALPVVAFSLLGVPVVFDSIHGAYLRIGDGMR